MSTQPLNKAKGIYHAPEIQNVKFDNEISLVLASDPNPMGDPMFSTMIESFGSNSIQSPSGLFEI
jgi:hypothetical protein